MDTKQLTRSWIQYLKSLKIVDLNSDDNGKLTYRRPVTVDDVAEFLDVKTEYSLEEIKNAVAIVLAKKGIGNQKQKLNQPGPKEPGRDLSTWMYHGMRPGEHPTKRMGTDTAPETPLLKGKEPGRDLSTWMHYGMRPGEHPTKRMGSDVEDTPKLTGKPNNRIGYDPNSISDIDYKEIPAQRRDPRQLPAPKDKENPEYKPRFRLRKVKEDITDNPGAELDENDVELIFKILTGGGTGQAAADAVNSRRNSASGQSAMSTGSKQSKKEPEQSSPEELQVKKNEDMIKLKKLIRDVMTDSQRKSFWRLLKDQSETLAEDHVTRSDVKAILQTAVDQRNNPTGISKFFKGLRKDKIEISDIQKAWADAGYPIDTRDITKLLSKQFGFSEKEIKKVFSQVFGTRKNGGDEDIPDEPGLSDTVIKIAKYVKNNNLTQDVLDFMADEYGFKESYYPDKLMIEDIRQIFTAIVQEERSGRFELIKQHEKVQLGRTKK